jgi:hypothetical protein
VCGLPEDIAKLIGLTILPCRSRGDPVGQLYVNVESIEKNAVGDRRIYPPCHQIIIVSVSEYFEAVVYARA